MQNETPAPSGTTLDALGTAAAYSLLSVLVLGIVYPLVVAAAAGILFPRQAGGSLVHDAGRVVGSDLIGQAWSGARYFHGRPSAAGKGYDPTSTGATNLGPTSKTLAANTAAALQRLRKDNPDAEGPVPVDLITSSASGVDPDISPEAAYFQVARIARARGRTAADVSSVIGAHVRGRELGFLGEPRVNVLELNLALDGKLP